MNLIQPASIIHAEAELLSAKDAYKEALADAKSGKFVDGHQTQIIQNRIKFLRQWIKNERDGKGFPCRNCAILEELYRLLINGGFTPEAREFLHRAAYGRDDRLKALPNKLEAEINKKKAAKTGTSRDMAEVERLTARVNELVEINEILNRKLKRLFNTGRL